MPAATTSACVDQCARGAATPTSDGSSRTRDGVQSRSADELDCAARCAHDEECSEDGHLGGELGRLRRDQQCCEKTDPDGIDAPPVLARRDRLRVGDHEEEEDEDLRRGDQQPPELGALDRPDVPGRRHRVPTGRQHADPRGERDPEADCDSDQVESPQDEEATRHDEHECEDERGCQRSPPQREWIRALGTQEEEAEHEPEVGGVEDVPSANPDEVLRQQRDRRRPGEDPPAVHAPPVAVLGSGHAEDEGDAVSRQECARRPHDDALAEERDRDLEDPGDRERDEDLRDRQLEVERDLPEHLERDDHAREVEARVA